MLPVEYCRIDRTSLAMLRLHRGILVGLVLMAAGFGYFAWLHLQRVPDPQPPVVISVGPFDLLPLVVDDEVPGLPMLLPSIQSTDVARLWVGRDPRLFDRGIAPERLAKLDALAEQFQSRAEQTAAADRDSQLSMARAKYAMALITAETSSNDNAQPWGTDALHILERMNQANADDWEVAFLLARLNRLLGQIAKGHDRTDEAFAHQLFASDLIRRRLETHPDEADLQLEWGIQLTYLAEAQLDADKAQLAFETFAGANECFEKCQTLLSPNPEERVNESRMWQTQDASRRYFEAYNAYSLALLLTRADQTLTAREYWSHSLDLFEGLSAEFPESMKFRQRYAQSVSNEGTRLSATDVAEALSVFLQAADLYRPLVEEAPFDCSNQEGFAMATGNAAMVSAVEDEYDAALKYAYESLNAWDKYLFLRPDADPPFRHLVVWKTAELLAAQAAEKLPTEPNAALAVAHHQQELVGQNWEQNTMLHESTTLHALELALAEEELRQIVDFPDQADEWLPVLEGLIVRLQARRPEDADVLALKEQLDTLRMTPQ